jgi:hypothetical protein
MSETKHTPGPWEIRFFVERDELQSPIGEMLYITSAMGQIPIARTDSSNIGYEANARLIAAAPEMYEALKKLVEHCPADRPSKDWADSINAIAKAEGK